ncbi:BatA domain-containing protein, partial [Falsiroseomonas oryziterrae]|uniref:BatA domain-containing protein n=1 Tax=Falsiroseomonas oryziterrae TaxID=2911368 RepID=UPI001F3FC8A6
MLTLGPIAFAAPWLLVALPALPVLWWLLRVTPPAPKRQDFPAIALLRDLPAPEETPARTPWWLLALRLLAAALIILGLARPVWGPSGSGGGDGPLLIVMDDGWASAADWPDRVAAAEAALTAAARDG